MTFVGWGPYRTLRNLEKEVNQWCNPGSHKYGARCHAGNGDWYPDADVIEEKNAYLVNLELPGVDKDAIKISFDQAELTVQGERKKKEKNSESDYLAQERLYGNFVRSFTLPKAVDADNIVAAFDNGILNIAVPKAEQAKARDIEIQ